MPRDRRRELISELEALRGSRVLVYVTGDRAPAPAQIGDDAVRHLYAHLREIGQIERLDLFLYSRGGAIDVPWRIASALRETAKEWRILIPFRANSAATLLALGADQIVMGRQGELGPIDPIMSIQRVIPQPGGGQALVQDQAPVEDIMAYVRFVTDRIGLKDQEALATALGKLTERLDAVSLGNAERTHSHIRDVARRMMQSRNEPVSEQVMEQIVETLAERVYAHGHAIGFAEAHDLGLPVDRAEDDVEEAMWALLEQHESDLGLLEPVDPAIATRDADVFREEGVIAILETRDAALELAGELEIRARRQMPPNLAVTFNLNLQVPADVPADVQQLLQQVFQSAQQQVAQAAHNALRQALESQAPILAWESAFRGGVWRRTD